MNRFHPLAPRHWHDTKLTKTLDACQLFPVAHSKAVHWVVEQQYHLGSSKNLEQDRWMPVGLASLVDIQIFHRRAEFLMGIQGREKRGGSIALSAALLALDFAFNIMQLQKLSSVVIANNPFSQQNTLSLGFIQEAYKRQHFKVPGTDRWIDSYENGLLKVDFKTNQRLAKLSMRLLNRDITVE